MKQSNDPAGPCKGPPSLILSVVIPSYRSQRTLPSVLAALERELGRLPVEIIIVDSTDTCPIAGGTHSYKHTRILKSPQRLSPGAARNLGARQARGRHILFLDADCEPLPGWGRQLWELLDRPEMVQSGALADGTPRNLAGCLQYWLEFSEFSPGTPPGPRSFLPTAHLIVERDFFLGTPGFREDYFMGEDLAFSARLASRPVSQTFEPHLVVCHLNRTSFRQIAPHLYHLGWWSGLVRRENPEVPGAFLQHWIPLIPFLLPLRWGRILTRLWRSDGIPLFRRIGVSLLAGPFLGVWYLGFARGICRDFRHHPLHRFPAANVTDRDPYPPGSLRNTGSPGREHPGPHILSGR